MEEKDPERIVVYGDMYDIHDNTFYGGFPVFGKPDQPAQSRSKKSYTDDELRERIDQVLPMVDGTISYLFPVIKVLMWLQLVPNHRFEQGVALLNRLYPSMQLNRQQEYAISKYDVGCFYHDFERWNPDDAPVKGRAYLAYYEIAKTLLSLF